MKIRLNLKFVLTIVSLMIFASCSLLPGNERFQSEKNEKDAKSDIYEFDEGITIIADKLASQLKRRKKDKTAVFGTTHHPSKLQWQISSLIENSLIGELSVEHGFIMLEREALEKLQKERELSVSGYRVGETAGAKVVITGYYSVWGNDSLQTDLNEILFNLNLWKKKYLRLDLKAIDVNSGVIVGSARVKLQTDSIKNFLKL